MTVKTLVLGPVGTNCYILTSESAPGKAIVIDPADEADVILFELRTAKLTLEAILLTHCHFDHIGAVDELVRATGAPLFCPKNDKCLLGDPLLNGSRSLLFKDRTTGTKPTRLLSDFDRITLGSESLTVLETPGHTEGSVCYKGDELIFTGDTLFLHGYGRTDLPGGNGDELAASLGILFHLDDLKVYPGHGDPTTIYNERRYFGL